MRGSLSAWPSGQKPVTREAGRRRSKDAQKLDPVRNLTSTAKQRHSEAIPCMTPISNRDVTNKPELTGTFPGWLRPFLSAAAWQHLSQGQIGASTKPFEATIFFCDVVNSSQLLIQYSLPAVVGLLNHFFALLQEIVHRHEGFTEKLLGDGLLAVFPSAETALNAAQAAQLALADLNAWYTTGKICPLLARVALDSGPIIITSLGGRWRMDYTVVGVPVHAASHLLRFAQPGEVWFTQATRDRLGEIDLLTEASLVQLKGYRMSQTVYRLASSFDRNG